MTLIVFFWLGCLEVCIKRDLKQRKIFALFGSNQYIEKTMTTINPATDIPSQINTLERLATWSIMALRRTNPTLTVIEIANQISEKAAQTALVEADDNTIRFIGRVSIELPSDYAEDNTVKLWAKAKELSNTALPEAFKQD